MTVPMRMTLSYRYLGANLSVLHSLGFPLGESLDSLGLVEEQLGDSFARLHIDDFLDLLDKASEQLDIPNLGLRLGYKFRIATFAQTGSIYGYCKDLKQVIALNARYQCLAIDAGKIEYETDGTRHFMQFKPYYQDQERYRQVTDIIMGAYGTAYRWLSWGSGEDLAGVRLPYAPPCQTELYEKVFQVPTTFEPSTDIAALEFSEAAMTQPLTMYDPERLSRAQAQLDKLLGAKRAKESLDIAIDEAIRAAVAAGRVTSHVVAERLGRDWPGLKQELKGSDQTFRERVDCVRQQLFAELYASGESFARIAQALAYNDQPSFNRAFKRWYDMSPSAWEKAKGGPRRH